MFLQLKEHKYALRLSKSVFRLKRFIRNELYINDLNESWHFLNKISFHADCCRRERSNGIRCLQFSPAVFSLSPSVFLLISLVRSPKDQGETHACKINCPTKIPWDLKLGAKIAVDDRQLLVREEWNLVKLILWDRRSRRWKLIACLAFCRRNQIEPAN